MTSIKNIGIIGLSEGNGHPYSWSAIFNGYSKKYMSECPFPVIPNYLFEKKYPEDFISDIKVSHIWTQNYNLSVEISKASKIPIIINDLEDIAKNVDAILLARDDAENHFNILNKISKSGKPIYIDKPIANSLKDMNRVLSLQTYDHQFFTCSAMKYADEFRLDSNSRKKIGRIEKISATIPKDWKKYAIHVIEPVVNMLEREDYIIKKKYYRKNIQEVHAFITWNSGVETIFKTLGDSKSMAKIVVHGDIETITLVFKDTFNAFKSALLDFINFAENKKNRFDYLSMVKTIEILEGGEIH